MSAILAALNILFVCLHDYLVILLVKFIFLFFFVSPLFSPLALLQIFVNILVTVNGSLVAIQQNIDWLAIIRVGILLRLCCLYEFFLHFYYLFVFRTRLLSFLVWVYDDL